MYFPESLSEDCKKHKWIINPFTYKDYNDYELDGASEDLLIELSNDGTEESHFRESGNYSDFWVKILQSSQYKFLATIAVKKLVLMPTTYLAERGFSVLVDIKTKKRNRLKSIDELMRGALEKLILPRREKIAQEIEVHASSSGNN